MGISGMRHWDISVAFTYALKKISSYVHYPKNMPDDIMAGFQGGGLCTTTLKYVRIKNSTQIIKQVRL